MNLIVPAAVVCQWQDSDVPTEIASGFGTEISQGMLEKNVQIKEVPSDRKAGCWGTLQPLRGKGAESSLQELFPSFPSAPASRVQRGWPRP